MHIPMLKYIVSPDFNRKKSIVINCLCKYVSFTIMYFLFKQFFVHSVKITYLLIFCLISHFLWLKQVIEIK